MKEQEQKIIQLWNEGKTYVQIRQETGAAHATISNVKKKYPDLIISRDEVSSMPQIPEKSISKIQKENNIITNPPINEPKTIYNDPNLLAELKKVKSENDLLIKDKKRRDKENQAMVDRIKKKDELIQNLTNRLNEGTKNLQQQTSQSKTNIARLQKQIDHNSSVITGQSTQYEKIRLEWIKYREQNENLRTENENLKGLLEQSKVDLRNQKIETAKYRAKIVMEGLKKMES